MKMFSKRTHVDCDDRATVLWYKTCLATGVKEAEMIRVRVEYDKYNRTFRLLDRELGSALEDGAVYELVVPITIGGLDEEDCVQRGAASRHHCSALLTEGSAITVPEPESRSTPTVAVVECR